MDYNIIEDELLATCPHCGCTLINKETGEPVNLLKLVEDDIKIVDLNNKWKCVYSGNKVEDLYEIIIREDSKTIS